MARDGGILRLARSKRQSEHSWWASRVRSRRRFRDIDSLVFSGSNGCAMWFVADSSQLRSDNQIIDAKKTCYRSNALEFDKRCNVFHSCEFNYKFSMMNPSGFVQSNYSRMYVICYRITCSFPASPGPSRSARYLRRVNAVIRRTRRNTHQMSAAPCRR